MCGACFLSIPLSEYRGVNIKNAPNLIQMLGFSKNCKYKCIPKFDNLGAKRQKKKGSFWQIQMENGPNMDKKVKILKMQRLKF